MKKILFILLAAVLVCGCKKENKADDVLYANFFYKLEQPLKIIIYDRCQAAYAQYDFGDGERLDVTELGSEITHNYKDPGSYNVSVRAFDKSGNSKEYKKTISIKKPTIYVRKYLIGAIKEQGKYYYCDLLTQLSPMEIYAYSKRTPKLYNSDLPYYLTISDNITLENENDQYIVRVTQMDDTQGTNKKVMVLSMFDYEVVANKGYPDGIQTSDNDVTIGFIFEYK